MACIPFLTINHKCFSGINFSHQAVLWVNAGWALGLVRTLCGRTAIYQLDLMGYCVLRWTVEVPPTGFKLSYDPFTLCHLKWYDRSLQVMIYFWSCLRELGHLVLRDGRLRNEFRQGLIVDSQQVSLFGGHWGHFHSAELVEWWS